MTIAVVGAGFSGAVVARELAQAGRRVQVFESRPDPAGNCATRRDPDTGVMVHTYGPHIFHTSNEEVWRYVSRFDQMMPFVNRVKAVAAGRVYPLPINLLTINSFFGRTLGPREAAEFINRYFATYPGFRRYIDETIAFIGSRSVIGASEPIARITPASVKLL